MYLYLEFKMLPVLVLRHLKNTKYYIQVQTSRATLYSIKSCILYIVCIELCVDAIG